MSKRKISTDYEHALRIVFHPRHGVKLSIGKSGLTIKFKDKKGLLRKYVDAMINHFGLRPLLTDVVTVNEPSLLPPDAPIDDLTEKLSALVASFDNLGFVYRDANGRLAWKA